MGQQESHVILRSDTKADRPNIAENRYKSPIKWSKLIEADDNTYSSISQGPLRKRKFERTYSGTWILFSQLGLLLSYTGYDVSTMNIRAEHCSATEKCIYPHQEADWNLIGVIL